MDGKKIRILLVEDNLVDAAVTRQVLKHNHQTDLILAANCKEALALLQSKSRSDLPQLILLDLNLPDISGIELLRRIKKDSTYTKPAAITGKDKTYKGVVLCQEPKARKIRSLWLELRDAGALKDSSEKALLAFVKRSTGVERMEWLRENQLDSVIEQLKNWLGRL